MEPKARTLQERMGFRDDELSTPRHDEIMLWLDENAERLFPSRKGLPWPEETVKELREAAENFYSRDYREKVTAARNAVYFADEYLMATPVSELGTARMKAMDVAGEAVPKPRKILELSPSPQEGSIVKTWEKPVLSGNYTVGFIDMEIAYVNSRLSYGWGPDGGLQWIVKPYPRPVDEECKLIEVKPSIRSIGELIRQINTYKTYRAGEYFVCSPDARFESALKSQRIGFVRAEI